MTPGTDQAVQVWRRGRLALTCWAVLVAALLAGCVFVAARKGIQTILAVLIILAVALVCIVAIAVRRKLTLTADALIVRHLFDTKVLPLAQVSEVSEVPRRGTSGGGLFALVQARPVAVKLADGKRTTTMSLGVSNYSAIQEIRAAVRNAGGPLT